MTDCKFILEFKSTHQKCVNFDGVRGGSICLLSKKSLHNVTSLWVKKREGLTWAFVRGCKIL